MVTGLRTLLTTLALASLVWIALFDVYTTVGTEMKELQFITANRSLSDDQKMLTRWGDVYGLMLFVNHATPPDAVVGFPPSGQYGNFPTLWHASFAYPRGLLPIGTYDAFLSAKPTHILMFKDFPPYTFPGDPRPLSALKSFDRPAIVAVRGEAHTVGTPRTP